MLTLDRKLHKKNIFLLILCLVLQFKNDKAKYSVNKSGTSHVRVSVVYLIYFISSKSYYENLYKSTHPNIEEVKTYIDNTKINKKN
jgi:hypothetical protein